MNKAARLPVLEASATQGSTWGKGGNACLQISYQTSTIVGQIFNIWYVNNTLLQRGYITLNEMYVKAKERQLCMEFNVNKSTLPFFNILYTSLNSVLI